MIFKTKEELLKQARKDGACYYARLWANKQPDLETILRECKTDWRLWALEKGYEQFAEHCDWSKLCGCDWCNLLCKQPKYYIYCNWNLLSGLDWRILLVKRPRFVIYCNLQLLNGYDWYYLLYHCPILIKYYRWDKLNKNELEILLRKHNIIKQAYKEKDNIYNIGGKK